MNFQQFRAEKRRVARDAHHGFLLCKAGALTATEISALWRNLWDEWEDTDKKGEYRKGMLTEVSAEDIGWALECKTLIYAPWALKKRMLAALAGEEHGEANDDDEEEEEENDRPW